MAVEVKVADLYSQLGLRTDHAAWKRGQDQMTRFTANAQKRVNGLSASVTSLAARFAGFVAVGQNLRSSFNFAGELENFKVASDGAITNLDEFEEQVLSASDATNTAKESLLAGTKALADATGNSELAADSLELLGKVTTATKSKTVELGKTLAAMNNQLDILPEKSEKGFSVLMAAGKLGGFELKDMARHLPSLTAQISKFAGGKGVAGLATLASMLQIVKRGFGSAGETATATSALFRGLEQGATRFAEKGIAVYGKDGRTLRNIFDIIDDIEKKKFTGKQLGDLFGRIHGKLAFDQVVKIRGEWKKMRDETMKGNHVQKDFDERMKMRTEKLRRLWNLFRNQVHRVTNEVITFAVSLVDWFNRGGEAVSQFRGLLIGLGVVMVGVAARAAIAWAATLAPFIILGAGVSALIQLFESLTGRDFFEMIKEGLDWLLKQTEKGIELLGHLRKGLGMDDVRHGTIAQQKAARGLDRGGRVIKDKELAQAEREIGGRALAEARRLGAESSGLQWKEKVRGLLGGSPIRTFPSMLQTESGRLRATQARAKELRFDTAMEDKLIIQRVLRAMGETGAGAIVNNITVNVAGDGDAAKIRDHINEQMALLAITVGQ